MTPRDSAEGEGDYAKLCQALEWTGGSYLIVEEDASNLHYHWVLATAKDIKQVRNAFTRIYGKTGNKVLSIKSQSATQWPKARAYVSKGSATHPEPRGDPPIVKHAHGLEFTPAKVQEYYQEYWKVSADVKSNKNVSFPDHVLFYMATNNVDYTARNVAEVAVKLTLQHKKVINEYYLEGVVKMVLAKADKEYEKALIDRIADRVTNNFSG